MNTPHPSPPRHTRPQNGHLSASSMMMFSPNNNVVNRPIQPLKEKLSETMIKKYNDYKCSAPFRRRQCHCCSHPAYQSCWLIIPLWWHQFYGLWKCVPVFSQCHPIRELHSSLGRRIIINWVESRLTLPCWGGPRIVGIGPFRMQAEEIGGGGGGGWGLQCAEVRHTFCIHKVISWLWPQTTALKQRALSTSWPWGHKGEKWSCARLSTWMSTSNLTDISTTTQKHNRARTHAPSSLFNYEELKIVISYNFSKPEPTQSEQSVWELMWSPADYNQVLLLYKRVNISRYDHDSSRNVDCWGFSFLCIKMNSKYLMVWVHSPLYQPHWFSLFINVPVSISMAQKCCACAFGRTSESPGRAVRSTVSDLCLLLVVSHFWAFMPLHLIKAEIFCRYFAKGTDTCAEPQTAWSHFSK